MIVKIDIDYYIRNDHNKAREDITVYVAYRLDRRNGAETFDVVNIYFVPELPNP